MSKSIKTTSIQSANASLYNWLKANTDSDTLGEYGSEAWDEVMKAHVALNDALALLGAQNKIETA